MHKSGFVAIVGRPNVGKSTLINTILGQKLCIVSPKAQTTRHRILGIYNDKDSQIIFVDSPGIIKPKYHLQKIMMRSVKNAIMDADAVILLMEPKAQSLEEEVFFHLKKVQAPIILAINKSDLSNIEEIQTRILKIKEQVKVVDTIAISALKKNNINKLIELIKKYLPESPPYYDKEMLSDRPERFFIAEIIREKIFLNTEEEIPYSCDVGVIVCEERENIYWIEAEIYVARKNHKAMLIGKNGQMIKKIGTEARPEIEELLQKDVFLNLYVKVSEDWKNDPLKLRYFGYKE
jgi:GTP-binding protein Era